MTHNEVFELLEELSLPIAYDHFTEGDAPDPPFLCFLYPKNIPFGADDTLFYQLHELDIELYTDKKDPPLEARVEKLLAEHELFFHKSEVWIEGEKMYEVLYEVTIDLQYEDEANEEETDGEEANEEETDGDEANEDETETGSDEPEGEVT